MAILYIAQQGAVLHKSGNRVIVKKDRDVLQEIPIVQLDEVVIFGNGHITTQTMGYLLHKNIPVSFLSSHGKYKGKLQPPYAKDTLIRRQQYAVADEPSRCLELAKCFVRGKLTNAVRFSQRQRSQNAEVKSAIRVTRQTLEKLERAESLDSLLGYEGTGAVAHYRAFRQFLAHDWGVYDTSIPTPTRSHQCNAFSRLHTPPQPRVYLHQRRWLRSILRLFHQPKHGHAALASDLMEEFRQVIVDGYVLSLVNNNRVRPEDFEQTNKGIRFTKDALDRFLVGYYGRMQQTFQHPTRNEKTTYLRCIELQVRHLARVITGKDKAYQPFLLRA